MKNPFFCSLFPTNLPQRRQKPVGWLGALLGLLAILATGPVAAQEADSFRLIRTYKGDVAGAALDNLDNLYVLSSTGQVKKFGPRGDSLAVFNGVRKYGKLSFIDATNPLTPLLFFKEFSNVVVLDRFLSVRASLNLRQFNILQPTAIGLSYDNNIWVFDGFDYKLKKVDEAGNLLLQTEDFRQLFGLSFAPQKIVDDNGLVHLADSAWGVMVFDIYGTLKRKLPMKGWNAIDIWKGMVVSLAGDGLVVYNPVTFTERRLTFPAGLQWQAQAFTTANKFVTFSDSSLHVYQIEK